MTAVVTLSTSCNTTFLSSRAGQGTWDLLATKE